TVDRLCAGLGVHEGRRRTAHRGPSAHSARPRLRARGLLACRDRRGPRRATEEILRYATEHGTGLGRCGTHRRRGFYHFVMGSVAEVIVRKERCPVLTVQHPERELVFTEGSTGEARQDN